MKKKQIALVVLLVSSFVLVFFAYNELMKIELKTIVVPDDYPTIVDAVGNASEGDTIFVKKGLYYENIRVDKTISLIGEDINNTIILSEGERSGGAPAFHISANNVKVSNFTIEGPSQSGSFAFYLQANSSQIINNIIYRWEIAIYAHNYGSSSVIVGNIMAATRHAVTITGGSINNITFSENKVVDNDAGITLDGTSNTVSWNTIEGHRFGLIIRAGTNNSVFGNRITRSEVYALSFYMSSNNTIFGNYFGDNEVGISFRSEYQGEDFNRIYDNNFVDNRQQVSIGSSEYVQFWDNGYPSGGNYWSDYDGTDNDGDGIGDTPYIINEDNQDNYPLMNPVDIGVIPEFPSWAILPLFIVATLVVMIGKNKLRKKGLE